MAAPAAWWAGCHWRGAARGAAGKINAEQAAMQGSQRGARVAAAPSGAEVHPRLQSPCTGWGRPDQTSLPWRGRREAPAPVGLGARPAAGGGVALGSAQRPVSYAARSDAVLGAARAAAAPAAFLGGSCLGGASGTCARSAVKRSTQVGRWCSDLQARQWPCRGVSFTIS